ncbi:MAG: hypothetical protein ACRC33_26675 [Gemmataceae bacterium]
MSALTLLLFAQTLAAVDEVPAAPFRAHVEKLLADHPAAVTPDGAAAVRAALKAGDVTKAQTLIDAHCLFGVHVNPESRVKAVRGGRGAALALGKPTLALIRVHNEGGVTHPLAVHSEQAVTPKGGDAERWVGVEVLDGTLSGRVLEYRVIRLTPRQAGRREATFSFDVGQGTQDLGYRAEVPVLFRVSAGR